MQIIQRVLLVAAVIMIIGWGICFPCMEGMSKLQHQWELLQTERFLNQICRDKECSYEEYTLLHGALNYYGTDSTIEMEEYQKEQDMEGNNYYYGITWNEIREKLFAEGQYCFSEDSVIVLCVDRNDITGSQKNKYYDIVSGKD